MTPLYITVYAKHNGNSKERTYIVRTDTISCIENCCKANGEPIMKIRSSAGSFVAEGSATLNQYGELQFVFTNKK